MSTTPTIPAPIAPPRHALGLPEGSVRTILALLVTGLVCAVMLVPSRNGVVTPIPPYLLYLLFLILGHFFATLGHYHARPWPLHLPPFFVRLIIIGALMGTVAYLYSNDPDDLQRKWEASMDMIRANWYLPVLLLAGFFVGVVLRSIVGRTNPPVFVQDLEAWVALIGVIGLCIAGFIHLVINPSLQNPIDFPNLEGFLAVVVVFYFGARS
ncbi:MAG: hypothetical protein FJ271_14265 [Planctomycetes bacterium]|nr:hypothetical protein [Planctomycetota bacterium]